jgi:DNA-binding NtrC family response regulator
LIRAAIIEDNPERMELHKQALKRRKCIVVGYTTVEAGISGIATSPSTDLIISDLNFDPDDDSNQDGLNIGYYLKRTKYPRLSVVCSAKYLESDSIFVEAKKNFDRTLPHNGGAEIYDRLVEEAIERRNQRRNSSTLSIAPNLGERANKIRAVYEFDSGNSLSDTPDSHFNDGYKLLIVEPIHSEIPCGNPFFL